MPSDGPASIKSGYFERFSGQSAKRDETVVVCCSNEYGEDLLQLCDGGIDGARVNSCHPSWKRDHCDPDKRCSRFFPDGEHNVRSALSRLLRKPMSRLTGKDLDKKAYYERKGYKKCRMVRVRIEEVKNNF